MKKNSRKNRYGAVLPMFAMLLPVIFILCGFAINTAHLRLVKMEMKIATDASAHAAGRAMSIHQTTDHALIYAKDIGKLNLVGGKPLIVDTVNLTEFGFSVRDNNGFGRFDFQSRTKKEIDTGQKQANSVAIIGHADVPLAVRAIPNFASVDVSARSVSTQVDRDIALVLDRSGSMLEYKDTSALDSQLYWLRRYRRISRSEYSNARNAPYRSFSSNVVNRLTGDFQEYAYDCRYRSWKAPRHSRWDQLNDAVDAFLDVLDDTDQEEFVSCATFASSATLEEDLVLDYSTIRSLVDDIDPSGATAIGQGIDESVPSIMTGANARPFAAKTIVVLTDGINNSWPDPIQVAKDLSKQYNVTIHTVTFTAGANQYDMREVAKHGGGKHYHASTGDELIEIFEEIANNLPTILTE